ncbi:aminoacyl-tRNA hydrolase [Desulfovibrio inopinatus]|uniref:aminoacyl-tRNA hydrolase n=1 Tax=Desulfovibrio inopinatus TaxID=102109 RepID=UPI0004214359|nr:aminoacyl-tRNA hydrolase [Desulfovibrio inopinatus]
MAFDGLLVGLGNPGEKYEHTRHNFGFWVVDAFLAELNRLGEDVRPISFGKETLLYESRLSPGGMRLLLAKPQTFMNRSGMAVAKIANFFKLDPLHVLVAHDELDLPVGRLKFKHGGGTAGHNGLKSIATSLGTPDFFRLRLGVSRPEPGRDVAGYVLNKPAPQEKQAVDAVVEEAVRGVFLFFESGFEKAVTSVNGYNACP